MKKNIFIILGIIIFAITVGQIITNTYLFKHLELLSYDFMSKFNTDSSFLGKNLKQADKNIVIVAIDNESYKELSKSSFTHSGYQPWEKNVWRNAVNFIEKGNPKLVMFNMVFEKPEDKPWYNSSFANDLKKYDNTILGTYLDMPLKRGNNFTNKIDLQENDFVPTAASLNVEINDKKLDNAITYTVNAPIDNVYTKNNIMGVINSVLDDDSVVRRNQPIFKLVKGDKTYYMPSLAFAGFLKYMGNYDKIVIKNKKILYKGRVIPLDDDGIVNISWHKIGRSYTYIPISKIILSENDKKYIKPEFFKDKIVIIGKTATGSNLDLSSIIASSYTSPEANAVALDNFINDTNPNDKHARKFIKEIPKSVQGFIIAFACIIVALLGLLPKSAFMGFLNGFISIIVYVSFSFWMFINPASRVWLPMVETLYYLTVTSGVVFAFRFYNEMTRKASIMNVFGKFVSPKVLATVLNNPDKLVLKNTRKQVTILFCDVRNFSTLSEQYDPEKLISNLNELFKEIVNIIFENGGTVDKFIGDCVMAYWGDFSSSDNDEFMAVKTALEIKNRINELKIINEREGKIVFGVKMGINTGEALLGLTGTDKIMNYTAMGDAVNVASRLETACSTYNRDILISESTYNAVKEKVSVLEIGKIPIKGKEEQIEVYEPTGFVESKTELKHKVNV